MSTIVTIGICTFRRPQIANTLASLSKVILPLDTTLHIVVADNDDTPSAQVTVATAAAQVGLTVTYIHAPAHNIAIARNSCLAAATGDYLAFLDDDEFAEPLWLSELLNTQRSTGADVVLGPIIALYPPQTPRWALAADFHSTAPAEPESTLTTGYAGNVLMNLTSPALTNVRFDERFGTAGGEDTNFFRRAHKAGARIAYNAKAIVYEPVPVSRANLKWLLRRHYRYGQTHAFMLLDEKKPRLPHLLHAATKMLFGYAMVILTCLMPVDRRRWLLRGTRHLAVLRTLWHNNPIST